MLSAAGHHTCVVTNSGGVKCWGYQSEGGLGDGVNRTTSTPTPVSVVGVSGVASISTGYHVSCAVIAADGQVKCWGRGTYGTLGDGRDTTSTSAVNVQESAGVGITGARLDYPDGRLQHVGMVLLPSGPTHCWIGKPAKEPGYFGSTLTPRNYSAVTAAAMLVRAEVFDAADGFDTAFARDYNDVDFCLRVQGLGHRVARTPYARFIHHEGASLARRKPDAQESRLFHDRWVERMPVDPCYSPALNQQLPRLYEAL